MAVTSTSNFLFVLDCSSGSKKKKERFIFIFVGGSKESFSVRSSWAAGGRLRKPRRIAHSLPIKWKKKQQKKSLGVLRFSSCPHHVAAAKEHAWSAVASSGGVMHVGRCRAHALEKNVTKYFFQESMIHGFILCLVLVRVWNIGRLSRLSTNFTDTDDHWYW